MKELLKTNYKLRVIAILSFTTALGLLALLTVASWKIEQLRVQNEKSVKACKIIIENLTVGDKI